MIWVDRQERHLPSGSAQRGSRPGAGKVAHRLAVRDRLQWPGGPPGVVAQGGGDAGVAGQAQDGDGQVAQAGHDAGAVPGTDLGGILAEGTSRTQCRLSSMDQCPRKKSASWAGLAWVTVSEVTA